MKRFAADLHIHTALSPCAEQSMSPARIVAVAESRGLDMIAVCDHNCAGNVAAVQAAAAGGPLAVVPGIEITTREEVHVLGLFAAEGASRAVSEAVQAALPPPAAEPDSPLLSSASALSLSEAVALIRAHGGLAVAAHVDRRAFSVLGQLGLMPEEPRFDAAEISAAGVRLGRAPRYLDLGLALISGSDSHCPDEIGAGSTLLEMAEPSFGELALALRGADGRRCRLA